MTKRWNVTGEMYVSIGCVNPESEWVTDDDKSVPEPLRKWLQERCDNADGEATHVELAITVSSVGYSSPGTMYARNGDPGDPPEGDDQRTVEDIDIVDGKKGEKFPKELYSVVESWLETEIKDLDIDTDQDVDEPEYD